MHCTGKIEIHGSFISTLAIIILERKYNLDYNNYYNDILDNKNKILLFEAPVGLREILGLTFPPPFFPGFWLFLMVPVGSLISLVFVTV